MTRWVIAVAVGCLLGVTADAQTAESVAPPDPNGAEQLAPKDGKWLREKDGRQYFLLEIPRVEGEYVWLDAAHTRIQTRNGVQYEVAKSGTKSFRVKLYRVENVVQRVEKVAPAALPPWEGKAVDRLEFTDAGAGLPTTGQWRDGFVVADIDQDGALDLVHGSPRHGNGNPVVFRRDGAGRWGRKAISGPRPSFSYDYGDVAVADFNGDGRPDIAVASHLRGIVVLVSDERGTWKEWSQGIFFEIPGSKEFQHGFTSRAIVAGDWNGDGRPDIIALGEGPKLAVTQGAGSQPSSGMRVFLNGGDGTWTSAADDPRGSTGTIFGHSLSALDLDRDGHLDALLSSDVLGLDTVLRWGRADGSWDVGSLELPGKLIQVPSVAIADLDGDGQADLLLGTLLRADDVWRTALTIYYGKGNRAFERRELWYEQGYAKLTAVAAGDLDGDGVVDIAASTGDGRTLVFLGDGRRGFELEQSPEITPLVGCRGYGAAIVDLDHDGAGELLLDFAGEPSAQFAQLGRERCSSQGAIKVWKAHVKTPPTK